MRALVTERRLGVIAVALAVAAVLADSSIVILALPEILNEYSVEIPTVAWVLTAFNLVLALCAVPAAYAARHAPRALMGTGLVIFAGASLACAIAPGFSTLLWARCIQAVGGALVVCAALDILPSLCDSERAARRVWSMAGAIGLAIGPALGGALTQLLSWRAIFAIQVPIILAVLMLRQVAVTTDRRGTRRPSIVPNVALFGVSAALTAALFLLVLLLINGWGMQPLAAAIAVSVMPVAAIASDRFAVFRVGLFERALAGTVATMAGVAGLGLIPRAGVIWTVLPQVLVGIGLGLSIGALTGMALRNRSQQAIHGGWTIASRHLGVVAGIVILTPVFVADFDRQQERVEGAIMATALDAPVDLSTKLRLMREGVAAVTTATERIPDLEPIFGAVEARPNDRDDVERLKEALDEQLRRSSSAAVSRSFLFAALFGVFSLVPLLWAARRRSLE